MINRKTIGIGAACVLLALYAAASDFVKGNLVLDGKTTEIKYAYAWVEPDSALKLLFSEKPHEEPQNESKRIPIALEVSAQLTSPDSVRLGLI